VDDRVAPPRDAIHQAATPQSAPVAEAAGVAKVTSATSCIGFACAGILDAMALEHAILVSLREQPASGLELAHRFDRSIGFFWSATHQQIYRVLGRMEADGWVRSVAVEQHGRPDKKVYKVTSTGRAELATWLTLPMPMEKFRSELAVRLRGASYGDRQAVLETVREQLADHATRLAHYEEMAARDFPDPTVLSGHDLDVYLVLRGGIRLERFWVDWLTEYLDAHDPGHDPGHDTSLDPGHDTAHARRTPEGQPR
jgi:DNA-binding PadR family transcriptional regulator